MNFHHDTIVPDEVTPASVPETDEGQSFVGLTLKGRYLIEKRLAIGGFGVVYLARDLELVDKPVVIKILREKTLGDEWAVQKFKHEIEALARIDHPGVVGVLDTGKTADGVPFLAMQYVEGTNLRSAMKPEGMDLEKSADIIRQLGQALSAAHEKNVIHRDLKPENIMLQVPSRGGQVKVIDFGIAKVRGSLVAPSTEVPTTAGTIAYMSPEQLNRHPVSAGSDIYSFAAIAYEMLTGRRPFNPETLFQLSEMQRAGVKVKPSDLRPSLSTAADRILVKALSPNPSDRYSSARAFADALSSVLSEPVFPLPPPVDSQAETLQIPAPLPRAPRRGKALLLTAGVILLAGILVTAYFSWRGTNRENNPVAVDPKTVDANLPNLALDYSLSVQRKRDGTTFQATGREILENGQRIRVNVSSLQSGFLYMVNEGNAGKGALTYNLLFPMPSMNGGSAHFDAGKQLSTNWYGLDENEGTENFWVIWSDKAVPELEAVKGVVNPREKGRISDPQQVDAVRTLLAQSSTVPLEVKTDETTKVNHVTARTKVLANLIKLEHR